MFPEYDTESPDLTLVVGADQDALEAIANELDEYDALDAEVGALKTRLVKHQNFARFAKMLGQNPADFAARLKRQHTATKKRQATLRRMTQRNPARGKVCRSYALPRRAPITAKDIAGRVKTRTPLFAVLRFADGPLQDSIRAMGGPSSREVKVFHKGIDDPGSSYGYGTPIDRHITNLLAQGALADGSTFIGYSIEVDVERVDGGEVTIADLRRIGKARLRFGDRNGANMVDLALARECPPQTGIIESANNGAAAVAYRFTGEAFASDTPILSIKGGEKGHEMRLEFPDATVELDHACDVRVSIKGKHYQLASS